MTLAVCDNLHRALEADDVTQAAKMLRNAALLTVKSACPFNKAHCGLASRFMLKGIGFLAKHLRLVRLGHAFR